VPVPPIGIWLYWHAERDADPVLRWLRERIAQGAFTTAC
jgi:DNA-binding transcriptional LysR family regulator